MAPPSCELSLQWANVARRCGAWSRLDVRLLSLNQPVDHELAPGDIGLQRIARACRIALPECSEHILVAMTIAAQITLWRARMKNLQQRAEADPQHLHSLEDRWQACRFHDCKVKLAIELAGLL